MARRNSVAMLVGIAAILSAALAPHGAMAAGVATRGGATDELESARQSLRTRQFAPALQQLEVPAQRGVAEAQYLLGLATLAGPDTPAGRDAGLKWLRAAAQQGQASAAWALAGVLAGGDAASQNEAHSWLERAAASAYPPAVQAKRLSRLPLASETPTARSERGLRLLFSFWSARRGDATGLDAAGARDFLRETDEFGRGLLAVAAESGAAASVDWLIAAHADVNQMDSIGTTPLMLASAQSNAAATQALLKADAKPDATDRSGRTALMFAAWADHGAQVTALIEAKANINLADERGWTALDFAIQRDRSAAAALLKARGASAKLGNARQASSGTGIDPARPGELYRGWAPLLIAASRDDVDVLRRLLASGANINALTPQGDTALHVAIDAHALPAAQALLAAHIDWKRPDHAGHSALAKVALNNDVAALNALLADGVDPRSASGETPPLVVDLAQRGHLQALTRLLDAGLPTTGGDAAKQSALIVATRAGNAAMADVLLAHGADARATDKFGRGALWYAAVSDNAAVLESLLRAHVMIDAQDQDGVTPLIAAAAAGRGASVIRL